MKNRGFTIVEMLIIVVLMGILLVVGFNTFGMYRGRNRQNLRDVSTQFYRDFSLIRMDSIAQNTPFMIEFEEDPSPDSLMMYSFYRYDIMARSWEHYKLQSGRGVQNRHGGPFITAQTTDGSDLRFAFDSNGMVVNPDDLNLPLTKTFTLSIERGVKKDVHTTEIFPSGGIHVIKKLDQE